MISAGKTAAVLISLSLLLTGCTASDIPSDTASSPASSSVSITGEMELQFAEQFSVSFRSDSCAEITSGTEKFLFVPEGADVPEGNTLPVIPELHENIYLAASSAMDLFMACGAKDCIGFTSTGAANWSIEAVKKAVENDDIFYVGKYSAPDYEFLLSENCRLAIESTMITHSPEVKEKLTGLGMTVFTERSSYEQHPLGRLEWIKLYGLLTGHRDEAEKFFSEKLASFECISGNTVSEENKKTAAFFYITSAGYVNVRKPGDYVSKMIELAGGKYIFTNEDLGTDESELSTINMQMEDFYQKAKDADFIIYNSTIEGTVGSTAELLAVSGLFKDFKAFRDGNVYCTGQNMFQETSACADITGELNAIFSGSDGSGLSFFRKLE